jgi:glutathione S-transferase
MRLHSAPRSGNSYKVRLLLGLLGTSCEIVNYDTKGGETHAPGFRENVNPDGKVPVLELDDGTMLPESGAILYYLAGGTPYSPRTSWSEHRSCAGCSSSSTASCSTSPGPASGACGASR